MQEIRLLLSIVTINSQPQTSKESAIYRICSTQQYIEDYTMPVLKVQMETQIPGPTSLSIPVLSFQYSN